MVNVTIAVPDDLKKKMDQRPEMNWSELARRAWKRQLELLDRLDELDRLTAKSEATQEDVEELTRLIRKGRQVEDDASRKTSSRIHYSRSTKSTVL
ncbi:hypothetical protein HY994_05380 [Candidatus Micrarchaeota archaeon]|nr:hypothetical protein [Candidatus Micrarchaeota archaeon]